MAAKADSEGEESECEESEGEAVGSNGLQEGFPLASQHPTSPQACSSSGHSVPPSPSPSSIFSSISSSKLSEDDENSLHHAIAEAQRLNEASLRAGERLLSRALFTSGDRLEFGDEIGALVSHTLVPSTLPLILPSGFPSPNANAHSHPRTPSVLPPCVDTSSEFGNDAQPTSSSIRRFTI